MKTLFVLVEKWFDLENTETEIAGITDKIDWAHAFSNMDMFSSSSGKELEIATLNVLDKKLLEKIERWLDPVRNPLCICGHRYLHHRSSGSCKHNCRGEKSHQCKEFRGAKEQPPVFDKDSLVQQPTCTFCGTELVKVHVPRDLGDGRVWRWQTKAGGFYCANHDGWHEPKRSTER